MPDNLSDNRRIAKNTLLLYGRMLYSMLISLFTARVILEALGFEDYGLYNVIGSVVSVFVFIRSAMGNSVNRYITYSLGKGDNSLLNKVFSLSLLIHSGLAVIIIILCETIGLWFVGSYMDIPAGRTAAVGWVLQFSILSCALSVICVPYDAEIIAHERMGIFAVIQILNSTLNLAIAFAVKYFSHDKLIFYALLLLLVQVMNRLIYGIYCGRNFPETKFRWVKDGELFKEMTGFAGWSLIGNLAFVGYSQGLNIVLNVFFGPVVNAARGIASQVHGAVKGFVTNFQIAVNPQITKSYAIEDYGRLHSLVFASSKLSFYLLLCIVLPIALESERILLVWLDDIPNYTSVFTVLTLIILLIDPLCNPIDAANRATGNIKVYQIVEGCCLLLIVPVSYFAVKYTGSPLSVYIVQLFIMYIVQILRLFLVCHKIRMSIRVYLKSVLYKIVLVTVVSAIIPLFLRMYLPDTVGSMCVVIAISVMMVLSTSFFLGLTKEEQAIITTKLHTFTTKLWMKQISK